MACQSHYVGHRSKYMGRLKSIGNEGLSHAKRDIWSPYPTCPAVCLLEPGISSVMMLLGESSILMYFPIFGFITFFTRLEPKMLPNSTISSCFFANHLTGTRYSHRRHVGLFVFLNSCAEAVLLLLVAASVCIWLTVYMDT